MATFSRSLVFCLALLCAQGAYASSSESSPWLQVVRHTPYIYSHNWFRNLSDIRRWVLTESGYCAKQDRHLLFDIRAQFLTFQDDRLLREATQRQLNRTRQLLAEKGKVHTWVAGAKHKLGYPFALACDQPHVDLDSALARLLGWHQDFWVWGKWNGVSVGSEAQPRPLIEMVKAVFDKQSRLQHLPHAEKLWPLFVGQIVIESGAVKYSRSSAQALGMMQLMPAVLEECGIAGPFQQHRMAQLECATKLYGQNHRRLAPVFAARFGHLPEAKQEQLYLLLLVQAYHGGVGRIISLLEQRQTDATAAADYFAAQHQRFSAADIALGLIYHNMGRRQLGMASLYYLVDVQLAAAQVQKHPLKVIN